MKLSFRLFSILFNKAGTGDWWKSTDYLGEIFNISDELGLWEEFETYGLDGGKESIPIEPIDALVKKAKHWKAGPYLFKSSEDDENGIFLGVTLKTGLANVFIKISGDALEARRENILPVLIKFGCSLHNAFKDKAKMGPHFNITPLDNFQRQMPPRQHPAWPVGSLVDFVSKSYRQDRSGGEEDLQKLLSSPLPKGVLREDLGDLIIFHWIDNLQDTNKIASARSMQDQWFAEILDLPIAAGFNELGDHQESLYYKEPHAPLTLYNSDSKEGYKALVLEPDGSIDLELISEMKSWIKNNGLPDGTPLLYLHAIFPDRDSAIDFHKTAKKIGIKKLLYVDNSGDLWNTNLSETR